MGLISRKTDLKSLKYGHDRPGGGNSGQPYIQTDINRPGANVIGNLDDGLVRGGIVGAAKASVVDTIRIGKFLTDFAKGPLFIVKQVGLQLSNPRLESKAAVTGIGFIDRIASKLNDVNIGPTRIYNLGINTIAQVPVNAFGIHFNRHGLLPVQDDTNKYLAIAQSNNKGNGANNRLVKYANKLLPQTQPQPTGALKLLQSVLSLIPGASNFITPQQQMIDQYVGGPGSVYGIGKTFIRRYDYTNNGVNKQQPQEKGKINYAGLLGLSNQYFYKEKETNLSSKGTELIYGRGGFLKTAVLPTSDDIKEYVGIDINNPNKKPIILDNATYSNIQTENITLSVQNNIISAAQGVQVQNTTPVQNATYKKYKEIIDSKKLKEKTYTVDGNEVNEFGIYGSSNLNKIVGNTTNKQILPDVTTSPVYSNGSEIIKINIPWSKVTRELRVGSGRTDSINLTPIFSNSNRTIGDEVDIPGVGKRNINDLVKFRIQALNPTTDNSITGNWMIFRAYLTQFSDSIDASWNETKYSGRGDKFYIYDGFSRKIQIGFKVAALSSQEMEPMYQKLNYLMSNVMPDYSEDNLMRGPLVRMTVGNWIDGQDGIINSLSYTVPQDSPWEIAINEPATGEKILILPHVIEVTMTFTPIGSQTRGKNLISSKSNTTSHIAQNANESSSNQYITADSIKQGTF